MKVILFSISSCFIIGLFSFLPVIGGTTTEFERWIRPNNNKDNSNSADDLQYGQIQQEQELSRILSDDDGNNEAMMLSNFVIIGIVLFSAVFLFAVYCMICGGDPRAGARRAGAAGARSAAGAAAVAAGGGAVGTGTETGGGTGVVHGVVLGVVHGDGGVGFVGGGGHCDVGGGGFGGGGGGGDCGGGGAGGGDCGGGGC